MNSANKTYTVTASFGENPASASATSTTPDSTSYTACTTVQFIQNPCSNSTILTVDPRSAQATTPTKSLGEMQQDAQNYGWLSIYNEFRWSHL